MCNRPFVIAITGRIGSGKTTVTNTFAQLGVPIVDADLIARQLTAPGQPALQALVEQFGTTLLESNGQLARAQLRQRIFHSPVERQQVEAILHPLIYTEMAQQLSVHALTSRYQIAAIPLLFEAPPPPIIATNIQRILVVDTPDALLYPRLMQRGLTQGEIEAILATQSSRAISLARADDVLQNTQDFAQLHQSVQALHQKYQYIAQKLPKNGLKPDRIQRKECS